MGNHSVPEGEWSTSEKVQGHRTGSFDTGHEPRHEDTRTDQNQQGQQENQ